MISKERLELIGKATGLAALLFTVFTYAYNQKLSHDRTRYATATELIDRYRTDGVREAETLLDQRVLYYKASGRNPNDPEDFPEKAFDAVAKDVLFGYIDTPGQEARPLLPELFRIADFYGEVGFCLRHDMCQPDILQSYFCPRAQRMRSSHARLIEYYSTYSSSGEWIDGMEDFLLVCA